MSTDMYTKGVLTVIAFCLIIIAGKEIGIVSEANALGQNAQRVEIVNMLPISVLVDGGSIEVYGAVETY